MSSQSASSKVAQKQWEAENDIRNVDPDAIFAFDEAKQHAIVKAKPWKEDPNYFKKVKISALALLKMVMHARSGVPLEIMGLMQGKIDGQTFVVLDAFALPVTGTETRVDAGSSIEAVEYMTGYTSLITQVGRNEVVVGWYHSHPGFGLWLSGTDCMTQMNSQKWQDPFLAIVVDPVQTVGSGKVALGAFRTYPEGYKSDDAGQSEYQSVPLDKIEDFGVHSKQYYQLPVEYFKSSSDETLLSLLWNKYWVNTLSSSPLNANRDYSRKQILDLATKMSKVESEMVGSNRMLEKNKDKKDSDSALTKISKDSAKLSCEVMNGTISQLVKMAIFNEK